MLSGVMRWLVLVVIPVLALEHGVAGAATHLRHHPDHALVTVADCPVPQADGTGPRHDVHDGTSCDIVISGEFQPLTTAVDGSASLPGDLRPALLLREAAASSRSPPKPSLAALSVLRI